MWDKTKRLVIPIPLFLVSQALSVGLHRMASNGICNGISVGRNINPISHLMFADDCHLFGEIKLEELWVLKWVLEDFCSQSGQQINKQKSEFMVSPNISLEDRHNLESIFHIPIVEKPGIYLRTDLDMSKRKGDIFQRVFHRFQQKLTGWKIPLLSFAGREKLVKHSLLAIPMYLLSVF